MARFHGKILGAARLATLLAALGSLAPTPAQADPWAGSFVSSAVTQSLPDDPGPIPFQSARPLPDVPSRFLQQNDWPFFDYFMRAVRQAHVRATADQVKLEEAKSSAGTPCFSGSTIALEKARSASLFLLTVYESGEWQQGTGTIVRGSGGAGPDRVLTASHVVEPVNPGDSTDPIETVHAYDAQGLYLGTLKTFLRGDHEIVPRHEKAGGKAGLPISVANDLAVLEVDHFVSQAVEAGWNDRGAEVSPSQSDHVQFLSQRADGWAFNPGASGGAVFNADGQIIGVNVYYGWEGGKTWKVPDTGFVELLENAEGDPEHLANFYNRLNTYRAEKKPKTIRYGASMIALPLRQIELRQALDLTDVPVSAGPATQIGIVAAYPAQQCTVSEVRAHDVLAWPAQQHFEQDRLWQKDPPAIALAENTIGEGWDPQ